MSCKKYNAKRDLNEKNIVNIFKSLGATVQRLSQKDVPDLIVGYKKRNYLVEIKSKTGKLTKGQKSWHDSWNGIVHVITTEQEVIDFISSNCEFSNI